MKDSPSINNLISLTYDEFIELVRNNTLVIRTENREGFSWTDKDHPILLSNKSAHQINTIVHINEELFNQHKDEIHKALLEFYSKNNINIFSINKATFSQEILDYCLKKTDATIFLYNVSLTDEQLKQIKNSFVNVYLNGEKINSNYLVGHIKYSESLEKGNFNLKASNLVDCNYENFKYFQDDSNFEIRGYNPISHLNDELASEDEHYRTIFETLDKIDKLGKKLHFIITVNNRSIFNKYLSKYNFDNIKLRIDNDYYEYSYQEYIDEEEILESFVIDVKNSNLSPIEKYFAVYNFVKNYKQYRESYDDLNQARYIRYILQNDYMVCVGYSKLLVNLLDKVGIKANNLSVKVDTSYDNGFDQDNPSEIPVNLDHHQRVVVQIEDDKYNVHGLFMADPTWDNEVEENYLNHALLPFDSMLTSKRMFAFSLSYPILCFHSFEEYTNQINKLIDMQIERNLSHGDSKEEALLLAFKCVAQSILKTISCDDKINYFIELLKKCSNQEQYEYFYSELGNYLLKRINNPINSDIILKANHAVNKELSYYNPLSLSSFMERDKEFFPYQIPETEDHNLSAK